MPRRADGGGGRRGGGSAGVGGGSEGGDQALGVRESSWAVAVAGIRDGSKEMLELGESTTAGEREEEPVASEEEAEEKNTRRGEASCQW